MTEIQTKIAFQEATNLKAVLSNRRGSDVTLLHIDTLLDTFHAAPSVDAKVITLVKLYYATDAWLKKSERGGHDVNSRRAPAVQTCFVNVVNRLSEETKVLINLLPNWLAETFGKAMHEHGSDLDVGRSLAEYLRADQVVKYRVDIRSGLAYQQKWWLNSNSWALADSSLIKEGTKALQKKSGSDDIVIRDGYSGYVMSQGGDLYSGPHFAPANDKTEVARYHSSYFNGEPILCAGDIKIVDGVIVEISNRSGHYRPPPEKLSMAVEMLAVQGVSLARLSVSSEAALMTAANWLATYPAYAMVPHINTAGKGTGHERALVAGRGDTPLSRALLLQTRNRHARHMRKVAAFQLFDRHWVPKTQGGHSAIGRLKCAECEAQNDFYHDYINSKSK